MSTIAEALFLEAVVSHSLDENPIVATANCNDTLAVGGYANYAGFVAQLGYMGNLNDLKSIISTFTQELANGERTCIHIRQKSSDNKISTKAIAIIKSWTNLLPIDICTEDYSKSSLLIDTRTGSVGEYDPDENPQRRMPPDPTTFLDRLMQDRSIHIVYPVIK